MFRTHSLLGEKNIKKNKETTISFVIAVWLAVAGLHELGSCICERKTYNLHVGQVGSVWFGFFYYFLFLN